MQSKVKQEVVNKLIDISTTATLTKEMFRGSLPDEVAIQLVVEAIKVMMKDVGALLDYMDQVRSMEVTCGTYATLN